MGNVSLSHVKRFTRHLAGILLEHRWLLLVLLSFSAIIFEILEHKDVDNPVDIYFAREIILFGVIYPLIIGVLLNILLGVQADRNAHLRQREIELKLNHDLFSASSRDELCHKIVSFPSFIMPVTGVALFTCSKEHDNLKLEAVWRLPKAEDSSVPPPMIPQDHCGVADHAHAKHLHVFASNNQSRSTSSKGYCLPLFDRDQWIGVMQLYLPSSEPLTTEQTNTLNYVSSLIALAMQSNLKNDPLVQQAQVIQDERQRIARHLHDTLGQNLAYLRLMLDKMATQGTLLENNTIQRELERMQEVASEAHEQIRDTLIKLKPEGEVQLSDLLISQAEDAAKESDFVLNHAVTGEPFTLPFTEQRKIHVIFREAILNVRRHARAREVQLSIQYEAVERSLRIVLSDDGIGFIPNQDSEQGHFGLLIMRQRAEEIGGELTIVSEPGRGTRVELRWAAK